MSRIIVVWIVYAGIMGFALGGSFVSMYLASLAHVTETFDSSSQSSKEKSDEALARYTWWLTAFTGGLAFATIALCIATFGLYLTGEKQIEVAVKSANAAELSAKAAIALQMPILRISPSKLAWGETLDDGEVRAGCYVHDITYANLGATKAFPIEVRYGFTVGEQLPVTPSYPFVETFTANTILDPGQSFAKRLTGEMSAELTDWPVICSGKKDVWFYCSFVYEDLMRSRRVTSDCWRWQSSGMGMDWRVEAALAYNQRT